MWNIQRKEENVIILVDTLYLLYLLKDIYEGNLSLKHADEEKNQIN